LRAIAASEGFTIQASELGKFKMLVQIISVVAVILARRWHEWPLFSFYIFPVYWIAWLAIWFMVVLSLVSALDYFIAFWSRIDRQSERRRRRSFVLARRRKRDVQAV
jgi:CDP-diacylglycerol--glycerol-3-phosphate 3-phosphatidyltransferase